MDDDLARLEEITVRANALAAAELALWDWPEGFVAPAISMGMARAVMEAAQEAAKAPAVEYVPRPSMCRGRGS